MKCMDKVDRKIIFIKVKHCKQEAVIRAALICVNFKLINSRLYPSPQVHNLRRTLQSPTRLSQNAGRAKKAAIAVHRQQEITWQDSVLLDSESSGTAWAATTVRSALMQ